jgi:hypothetical protein
MFSLWRNMGYFSDGYWLTINGGRWNMEDKSGLGQLTSVVSRHWIHVVLHNRSLWLVILSGVRGAG